MNGIRVVSKFDILNDFVLEFPVVRSTNRICFDRPTDRFFSADIDSIFYIFSITENILQ